MYAFAKNPSNWTESAMCVQDLVQPNLNIALKIPEEAAVTFQKCCETFAKLMRENRLDVACAVLSPIVKPIIPTLVVVPPIVEGVVSVAYARIPEADLVDSGEY